MPQPLYCHNDCQSLRSTNSNQSFRYRSRAASLSSTGKAGTPKLRDQVLLAPIGYPVVPVCSSGYYYGQGLTWPNLDGASMANKLYQTSIIRYHRANAGLENANRSIHSTLPRVIKSLRIQVRTN
jgi:hypothetical protein